MKQFILLFLLLAIVSCSKKKDFPQLVITPSPPPLIPTYTITASAGNNGSVMPSSITVQKGDSAVITFRADSGYRISTLGINGVFTPDSMIYSYTFKDIKKDLTISGTFTDSLLKSQINSIIKLITLGKWYDVADSTMTHIPDDNWSVLPIPSCARDVYDVYYKDGIVEEHLGAHPCSSDTTTFRSNWTLSYNGKKLLYVNSNNDPRLPATWYQDLISVNDSTIVRVYDRGDYIFKYVSKHSLPNH